jgi:hypothetical protein
MKYAAALLLVGSILSTSAIAADKEEGFVSLFDGKSLKGWKINEKPESWKIADGAITANGSRSHLFYVGQDKPFVNFEFRAQVMTRKNSNAGIFFHTKFQSEGWPKQGYEAQVNNTYNRDPQKTGGLYNTVKVLKAPAQDDKWFDYTIRVEGKHVVVKIDGKTVVDYTEPKDKPGPLHLSQGTFALQAHDPGSTVSFQKIRVKRLP